MSRLTHYPVFEWSVRSLGGWLISQFIGRSVGQLIGCLVGQLILCCLLVLLLVWGYVEVDSAATAAAVLDASSQPGAIIHCGGFFVTAAAFLFCST